MTQHAHVHLNSDQVRSLIPHGPLFTCVDELVIDKTQVVTTWQVPSEHPGLVDHFPGSGVVPGVMLVEAMAQSAGLIALWQAQDTQPTEARVPSTFVVTNVDKVRFRGPAYLGDTLHFVAREVQYRFPTCSVHFAGFREGAANPLVVGTVRVMAVPSTHVSMRLAGG